MQFLFLAHLKHQPQGSLTVRPASLDGLHQFFRQALSLSVLCSYTEHVLYTLSESRYGEAMAISRTSHLPAHAQSFTFLDYVLGDGTAAVI